MLFHKLLFFALLVLVRSSDEDEEYEVEASEEGEAQPEEVEPLAEESEDVSEEEENVEPDISNVEPAGAGSLPLSEGHQKALECQKCVENLRNQNEKYKRYPVIELYNMCRPTC